MRYPSRGAARFPMASFGENLRREREMRGVTLEEISAATKIAIRSLQALEEEDFSRLPGGIFTRSFIRAYARHLGLDEDSVLAEYQLIAPPQVDLNLSRLNVPRSAAYRRSSRAPLLGALVAVAMLIGGYTLYRNARGVTGTPESAASPGRLSAEPPPSQPQPQAPSPSAGVSAREVSAPATPGRAGPPRGSAQEVKPAASPQSGPGLMAAKGADAGNNLVLQVAATEESWVAIDADGKTVLQRVLSPHEIQTLKANESFDVMTGNAQGIILTLNRETLRPLGRRGEVKKIHLTRDDLKNFTP